MRWQTHVLIRWSDLDSYGHVNNVALAEYVQEARTRFLHEPDWNGTLTAAEFDSLIIVAHQEIEYLAQVAYRAEPVLIEVWVARAVGASVDLGFEIWDEARSERYVVATNKLTFVPKSTGTPRRFTDFEKAAAAKYAGEPVTFRRHSYHGDRH